MTISDRRDALLARFPSWRPVTLDGRLARCADEFGDRPLVITDEGSISYAQVRTRRTDWPRVWSPSACARATGSDC